MSRPTKPRQSDADETATHATDPEPNRAHRNETHCSTTVLTSETQSTRSQQAPRSPHASGAHQRSCCPAGWRLDAQPTTQDACTPSPRHERGRVLTRIGPVASLLPPQPLTNIFQRALRRLAKTRSSFCLAAGWGSDGASSHAQMLAVGAHYVP